MLAWNRESQRPRNEKGVYTRKSQLGVSLFPTSTEKPAGDTSIVAPASLDNPAPAPRAPEKHGGLRQQKTDRLFCVLSGAELHEYSYAVSSVKPQDTSPLFTESNGLYEASF